ncbi:AAA family ATPase [Candidatus Woesearchaeota archaeon]|nr:AAA family ATPase [Candidatus Woesearchaeota archaeon]
MALFKDMLKSNEELINDEYPLDFEYLPKPLLYRETEQRKVAGCIRPLLEGRNGRNVFIHGPPGVGKTAAIRHVLNELEDETDEVIPIYINCWQKNSSFKLLMEMCEILKYKFTHNKRTDELFNIVKGILNRKAAVIALDEVDKLEDFDLVYSMLEEIFKKSIIMITNFHDFIDKLDLRVKSRLLPEMIEFRPYNLNETRGILKQRSEYAFPPNVLEADALETIAKKTAELEDMRTGLHLMREAALAAENRSSRKIELRDVEEAIKKIDHLTVKSSDELASDEKMILDICRANSESKIGELFKIYHGKGGSLVYKSFQRKIEKLSENKFISTEKVSGGKDGKTTIVKYGQAKKLTDF